VTSHIIVLVSDRNDQKRGQVSAFDEPAQAADLIEGLLAEGIDQDRIRVFTGSRLDIKLEYRSSVTIFSKPGRDEVEADEEPDPELLDEVEAIIPDVVAYTRDGVRFSSMFSPKPIARGDMSITRELMDAG